MEAAAPAILVALEESGLAQAIRQSIWIYPLANILHIVSLTTFAGAIAVMDLRILGAFAAAAPASVIVPAQRAAVLALAMQVLTGLVLFTAEAGHVALNTVFQVKVALIAFALSNALLIQRPLAVALAETPPLTPLPPQVRVSAAVSLMTWIAVAACGRAIAYF